MKGRQLFETRLLEANWGLFHEDGDVDTMAERIDSMLSSMVTECFPEKQYRVKSTDDPRITEEIQGLISTRAFKNDKKRSMYWKQLKKRTDGLIKERKREYIEKFKEKAKCENNPAMYYKVIKMLRDKEKPSQFDVTKLQPGKSDTEMLAVVFELRKEKVI